MKRLLGALAALMLALALGLVAEMPTGATSSIQTSFEVRYGSALTTRYGCDLCHESGVFTEYNSYGKDLLDAIIETGECLEFYPPNTHTLAYGRCGYLHAPGLKIPFTSKCTYCHGASLEGLIAPSCFLCHGKRWTESKSAPNAEANYPNATGGIDDAFAAIEPLDSDGDGFSNIVEINATTHPGDSSSYPGGTLVVNVSMNTTWDRGWISSKKALTAKLTPEGSTKVDTDAYVFLKTKDGKLYSTRMKTKGTGVEVSFPKALLYTLFRNLNTNAATVTVNGLTTQGDKFETDVKVGLSGSAPELLQGMTAKVDPKKWDGEEDVKVTFKGKDVGLINTNKPIYATGVFKRVRLSNVRRVGNTITATIDKDDAMDLIGDPVEKVLYTVGFLGSSTEAKKLLATNAKVTGKVSDCYDFDPPASHSEPKIEGECTYMHPPNSNKPFASGCNGCHGSDLTGTGFAPSCFLCHGQLWSSQSVLSKLRQAQGGM